MKYNGQTACEAFLWRVEDYTVNIGAAAITTITTAKAGIDLGTKFNFRCINVSNPADNI
jgi:hypothetical protein